MFDDDWTPAMFCAFIVCLFAAVLYCVCVVLGLIK